MSFHFFARGLHTRTAVARLPLRQLGFLVQLYACSRSLGMSFELLTATIGLLQASLQLCACTRSIGTSFELLTATIGPRLQHFATLCFYPLPIARRLSSGLVTAVFGLSH